MRLLIGLIAIFCMAMADDKAPKSANRKGPSPAPKPGIKTPGVQIPFAHLKPEAEFEIPGKPEWIFYSPAAFAPGKDTIEKIDAKTNKKGDPIPGLSQPCGGMASAFDALWAPV